MLGRVVGIVALASAIVLALLLYTTTPSTIGPLGILIVFILMYLSALGVLTFLLYEASKAMAKGSQALTVQHPFEPFSLRRAYYYSTVIALVPVMLIGMQSVGTVGLNEVLLVIVFVVIACIYISKLSR